MRTYPAKELATQSTYGSLWDMHTDKLDYILPPELIAQHPADQRTESRLLVMERKTGTLQDRGFGDLIEFVEASDCLVLNDTKVTPARFFAHKPSGARLEGLFLETDEAGCWVVMLKNSRKIRPGEALILCGRDGGDWGAAEAARRQPDGTWLLKVHNAGDALTILGQIGYAPLPPYVKRSAMSDQAEDDLERYQTVYARRPGAVAAPTAGLHFSEPLLERLRDKGARMAYVTLHVGPGTFRPVKTERLEDHQMHSERYEITEAAAAAVNQTIDAGGRIIAVGTTSVRTLETVAGGRSVRAATGQTALFIQPGYRFKVVDAMITNFHLPRSTLLALVAAFAGLENVLAAYRHAIEQRYRFYSYGDAMLVI